MENIRAIIIDDEEHGRITLHKLLEWVAPDMEVLTSCSGADEGIEAISRLAPNLVFLDIEMPVINGFEMLRRLKIINFEIIFTTAYDQFAVEAFKVNALDYLLKPISEDELANAIQKVRQVQSHAHTQEKLLQLFETLNQQKPDTQHVGIPTMEGMEFIEVSHIVNCVSEGNYTRIYLKDDESIFVSKTLKEIEQILGDYPFFRAHNSHLVHLIYVKKYLKGKGGQLILKNGKVIPVSRAKKHALLDNF